MPRDRKPLDVHKLAGTRPEYVATSAVVKAGRPRYPHNISPEAKRVFKNLSRLLEARRSLTEGDGELLRLYALTYDRHARAISKLLDEGEITTYFVVDKDGNKVAQEKPNNWLKVAQDSERYMRGCLSDLGLNPMNRAKVKPTDTPADQKPVNPEERLLSSREPAAPAEQEVDLDALLKDAESVQ